MLGGSVYQLRWDGLETGPNATTIGWGFVFSGGQNFSKKVGFKWNASAGNGWGTNVFATLGTGNTAILTPEENLEAIFMWNLDCQVNYSISPLVMLNLQGGWINVDPNQFKADNDYNTGAIGHFTFLYSPVKSLNIGAEYQIAQRVNIDGKSGVANRFQISGKYIF